MKRVYHHYSDLEEYHCGLWRITSGDERRSFKELAADLMANSEAFQEAMARALIEWPRSCEHNLSAENINRIAWLGHAGCCVARGCPEEATRAAWHTLTVDQQNEANRVAGIVLAKWDHMHAEPESVSETLFLF
jgi:hypothetical protein